MDQLHVIDLNFLEQNQTIAAFLLETEIGPILIETGPESTWHALQAGIESLNYKVSDIRHVLLTHIHFDHAGAAWKFARHGAKIYVHPMGLPHLQNPEKLWNSAKQIYKDDMERLWGNMEPIPAEQLQAVDDGDVLDFGNTQLKVWYTPGHAIHHNAYQWGHAIFTGDVGGVKIGDGPLVPPCPPPDINIELWKSSIEKIRDLKPEKLYLTHFALQGDLEKHFAELGTVLDTWANWVKPHHDAQRSPEEITPLFMEFTRSEFLRRGLSDHQITQYEFANPSWMSVTGLLRYWKLKDQGRI